jgi:hypothetical protein
MIPVRNEELEWEDPHSNRAGDLAGEPKKTHDWDATWRRRLKKKKHWRQHNGKRESFNRRRAQERNLQWLKRKLGTKGTSDPVTPKQNGEKRIGQMRSKEQVFH